MPTPKKRPEDKLRAGAPVFPYTREMAERICLLISTSSKGLKHICRANPDLPSDETIYIWRIKYPEFSGMYFEAKRHQALLLAEETLEIADDDSKDIAIDANGNEKINSEYVARSRLRVETRKWHAARLMPKVFGDRVEAVVKDESTDHVLQTIDQIKESIELLKKHERDY